MNDSTGGSASSLRRPLWCVIAFLALHAAWLAWSATWQSPTLNEPGHLASGIAHWKLGRFEPYAVNPPLVRMVAAIPVLATEYQVDWSRLRGRPGERPEFLLGSDFIKLNGAGSQRLFNLARWACLPFSLLGAWICFVWARALSGAWAGVLACGLWCVEPNIIGHGQLITPDVAATSLGLVAMWTFWQWLNRPGWVTAIVAGAGLGAAVMSKFSWVMLFGVWPAVWFLVRLRGPASPEKPGLLRASTQLIAMFITAIYIINVAYGFDGSFSRLDSFQFTSRSLAGPVEPGDTGNRFAGSPIGWVPVPVPRQMLLGLDLQKKDFEHFSHQSYLRGEWRQGGWWYYYLYAAAVKLPVGLWLLGLTALIVRWRRGGGTIERTVGEWVLLMPAIVLFVIVSSELEFNHHFRYALPCLGPVFILTSGVVAGAGRWLGTWIVANCGWIVVSSVIAAPHNLTYFNELAGGMRNGGAHLLHSNTDWGQDLVALQEWMKAHPETRPVYLAYYGFYDPVAYGVPAETAPQGPFWETRPRDRSFKPGWYAISVNYLHGTAWRLENRHAYDPLLKETPVEWCGGSIAIYRIDEKRATTLTEAVNAEIE